MQIISKYFQSILILALLIILGCNSAEKKEISLNEARADIAFISNSVVGNNVSNTKENLNIDALEIIVIQCSNGYEYAMHGHDFNPIIESELNEFEDINVQPFPYKTLMGVSYQGVFDKRYCPPIIEKVNVDFLVLTRFENGFVLNQTEMDWGYELRIVNTQTLEQVNSISAHSLKDYQQIEKHIKDNIEKLKADIEKLK